MILLVKNILSLCIFGGVLIAASFINNVSPKYAEITFENTVYNFDTVTTGTLVDSEFHFTNTGIKEDSERYSCPPC